MTRQLPLSIVARNSQQADYLVRSRAEQRGVAVERIDVVSLGGEVWLVSVSVPDADAEKAQASHLEQDTGVFRRPGAEPR